jgi:hypothetical protein
MQAVALLEAELGVLRQVAFLRADPALLGEDDGDRLLLRKGRARPPPLSAALARSVRRPREAPAGAELTAGLLDLLADSCQRAFSDFISP